MSALNVLAADSQEFHAPGLWLFYWDPLFHIGPLAVTKPMVLSFTAMVAVIALFWAAFARPKLVPGTMQNLGELGYVFIRDQIARAMIGKDGDRWIPLLFTLFFFIWAMNIMAIIPVAQFPVTSRIAYPAVLAATVYVLMLALFVKHQGLGFLKNKLFPPGLPVWVYPLFVPMEFFSTFLVRPFTHAVRLFANMFAGHIMIALFALAGWHFLFVSPSLLGVPVGIVSVAMTALLTAFELLIQFLQAFIFTILTAFYIGDAMHPEH